MTNKDILELQIESIKNIKNINSYKIDNSIFIDRESFENKKRFSINLKLILLLANLVAIDILIFVIKFN